MDDEGSVAVTGKSLFFAVVVFAIAFLIVYRAVIHFNPNLNGNIVYLISAILALFPSVYVFYLKQGAFITMKV